MITELAVGEALVSLLGPGGVPGIVDRTMICPPASRIGTITDEERRATLAASPVAGKYDAVIDRESAYERLNGRAAAATPAAAAPAATDSNDPWGGLARAPVAAAAAGGSVWNQGSYTAQPAPSRPAPAQPAPAPNGEGSFGQVVSHILLGDGRRQGVAEALAKSVAHSVGNGIGRSILRGVLGSLSR